MAEQGVAKKVGFGGGGGQGAKSAGGGGAWVRQIVPKLVPPPNSLLGTFRTFFSKKIVFKAQNASFGK